MQFEIKHQSEDHSLIVFKGDMINMKQQTVNSFKNYFERIGGEVSDIGIWRFPRFVTPELLQEIIHNTCFECGGLMGDSTAFKNDDLVEIPNGLSMTSHIYSGAGKARQIKIRKCTACGHSHT